MFKWQSDASLCYSTSMDHIEYLTDLRKRLPNTPSYAIVTRAYPNARGVVELIQLTQNYWDYVDWAEANTDIDFGEWVVHCDTNPCEGYSLSHQLMYWLWYDECNRFRQGYPTPNQYPPMGYEGWAEEVHGPEGRSANGSAA